jgi:hypothetical protein
MQMKRIPGVIAGAIFTFGAVAQPATQTVQTTVCQLIKNPDQYNGKVIEIRAHISASDEASVALDPRCLGSTILFLVEDSRTNQAAASEAELRRLAQLLKQHSSVTATIIGLFDHAQERRFGHQNGWNDRILATSVSDVRVEERGWLLGTVGFFGDGGFAGDAAQVKLAVSCGRRQSWVEADERGDYALELAPCRYRLINAVTVDGKPLNIRPGQSRTFTITRSGTTRFDVMLCR